jgi:hypothetical protein
MKKTLLALAVLALAGTAFATTPVATGSVNGTATSQVGGGTSSFSVANLPGQTSFHGSLATAQNCTTVVGFARPGTNGAVAGTLAVTAGSTYTTGGGSGVGATYAGASQYGYGNVTALANVAGGAATGQVDVSSTVVTGSMSTVATVDGGVGTSGTLAGAVNGSYALAGSSVIENGVSVRTAGLTAGVDGIKTFGNASPTNATITATGTLTIGSGEGQINNVGSFQGGTFNANITRTFVATPTGTGGPGGCVGDTCGGGDDDDEDKPKKPKGNNGYGNGDQTAPGGSGPNNNAENGNQGGSGSNGKPRKPN